MTSLKRLSISFIIGSGTQSRYWAALHDAIVYMLEGIFLDVRPVMKVDIDVDGHGMRRTLYPEGVLFSVEYPARPIESFFTHETVARPGGCSQWRVRT